jgi:transcription initiation factor IIE alpha subunit
MWLCPECKVYMKLDKAACIKCEKQIQYFENKKSIPLERMLVQVKFSQLNDI